MKVKCFKCKKKVEKENAAISKTKYYCQKCFIPYKQRLINKNLEIGNKKKKYELRKKLSWLDQAYLKQEQKNEKIRF